jgi:hypothetical protein
MEEVKPVFFLRQADFCKREKCRGNETAFIFFFCYDLVSWRTAFPRPRNWLLKKLVEHATRSRFMKKFKASKSFLAALGVKNISASCFTDQLHNLFRCCCAITCLLTSTPCLQFDHEPTSFSLLNRVFY